MKQTKKISFGSKALELPKLIIASTLIIFTLGLNAQAGHPRQDQMQVVKSIAHQMEEDSARLHQQAESQAHHGSWGERQALGYLHRLEEAAEHFHRTVESYYNNPFHTERDYLNLVQAVTNAEYGFTNLHAFSNLYYLFRQMKQTMQTLSYYYQSSQGMWKWQEVKRLAHEIEEAASHAHDAAERRSHHSSYAERQVINALHNLEERAKHLHDQVERNNQSPSHTRSDFYNLQAAVRRANSALRYAHSDEHVMRDFRKVAGLMNQLNLIYSGGSGHGYNDGHGYEYDNGYRGRYPRRDRYGNGHSGLTDFGLGVLDVLDGLED